MTWKLQGEYFENCNCDILCPCITSSMQGPADYDRCLVPLIANIRKGSFEDMTLDGLNFIMVIDAPAVMSEGNWRVAVYIDERATDDQRQVLGSILSGVNGGPPQMLAGLIGEQLGVKFVPITYTSDNLRKRVEVPGIMEFEVEGITAPGSDTAIEITNVAHPMGSNLPIAKSLSGSYNDPDYDFAFDNTGKNGHYREFIWQGD
jgi:hypothetical protein